MRVIFLDVDGVLNSREYDAKCALNGRDLLQPDPRAVIRLLGIIQKVEAATGDAPKIVLTSSWRQDPSMEWPFPVHDITPKGDAFGHRSHEIRAWMLDHRGIDRWVVIDDEPDAFTGLDQTYCIHTDVQTGLTAEDAARIVGLFT